MKKNRYFFSCVLSMLTVIMAPIALGVNWTGKGSSYTNTTTSGLVPSSILETTYDDPALGKTSAGTMEMISPNCITISQTASFSYVSAISAVTATVYERKYTANGTVSGILGDGTITSSSLDYYVKDIQSGPMYDLTDTTLGRSDWEITISGGVTHTGTTYYYYKPSSFSGGRVEGDIHGEFHFAGTDATQHPLAQVEVTSINGNPSIGTYAIVWDPPTNYTVEISEYTTNPSGIHSNVSTYYSTSASTSILWGGSCDLATMSSTNQGISFYLMQFNAGLYLGNWSSTPSNSSGASALYFYSNAPGARYALNASVVGGHGTVSPNSEIYEKGTPVTISAVPDSGYQVKSWSGTDDDSSTETTNTVTMNENRTVTVEFGFAYTLSASVVGGNGTVLPTSGTYVQGKVVTLTATPDAGYQVTSWSGTDDDSSTETTNTVTMDANRTVSVKFGSTSTNNNDKGLGCGGGCLITTSALNHPSVSEILLIVLLCIAYVGLSRLRKKHIDR